MNEELREPPERLVGLAIGMAFVLLFPLWLLLFLGGSHTLSLGAFGAAPPPFLRVPLAAIAATAIVFLATIPSLLLILAAWAAGGASGWWTGRRDAARYRDVVGDADVLPSDVWKNDEPPEG